MDIPLTSIKPFFTPQSPSTTTNNENPTESSSIQKTIQSLSLQPHIEGGYFVETDRHPLRIPNPFPQYATTVPPTGDDSTRSASSSIFYFLSPGSPVGAFHRNRGRTIHTLHRGRGRYVIIHADEEGVLHGEDEDEDENERKSKSNNKARIESFVVGPHLHKGERLQWIVEGGKFKSSYLLPDALDGSRGSEGLLISETVAPGFEFSDHDLMRKETMDELLTPEQVKELSWMLRKVD